MNPLQVSVRPGRQFPLLNRHPWVHQNSIVCPSPEPPVGTVVDLVQQDGRWVARGLYNAQSRLRVRLYTWNPAELLDEAWLVQRLDAAVTRRLPLGLSGIEQAVRLVFSEADGLSGLIVDRYGHYFVIQLTAAALESRIPRVANYLSERFSPQAIILRIDGQAAKAEGLTPGDQILAGQWPSEPILIREYGIALEIDLRQSQKTGLYLDQRENRHAAARYLRDRHVLDVCCYLGGFALAASVTGGAASVLGVDSSRTALEAAERNVALNGAQGVRFELGDMFDSLRQYAEAGKKFDAVVLDPPRLAGSQQSVDAARRAYQRLNREALRLLPAGGILITCSCTGRVSRQEFLELVADTARRAGRDLTLLEHRTAAPDHPVRLSCPETDYLKCLICEVQG